MPKGASTMHDDYDEIEHAALMEDLITGNSGVANARAEQRRWEPAKRDRTIRHAAAIAGSAYLGHQAKKHMGLSKNMLKVNI
jgi:hypothetical protein